MARKLTAAQGAGILLVTANVGSLFENPGTLQEPWLKELYKTVQTHKPHFLAVHCQELGGKSFNATVSYVKSFVKALLSSDALKEFSRACIYLDENYESEELFTALGSFYFIHKSLKNIHQFDFNAQEFRKVSGKEICAVTLGGSPMVEKEKFPQDYFPEGKWSRKGFIRTRWALGDCAFDLVNIHLFHDANNVVAWQESPSLYTGIRQKALEFVLHRITDQRYEKLPYFLFGDFNFRLDFRSLIESLCSTATMQTVTNTDTNVVDELMFIESDNDRKVVLEVGKKIFKYADQNVFRENNGTSLQEYDKELSVFKDRLHELEISFPPSYPYSEDHSNAKQYMTTRCPAWCDRILMSPSAKDLVVKPENEEKSIVYDNIGPNVCMGDHKPVFLSFRLPAGAGKPNANKHKCCVVQ
ncbi:inositol polyphosphate-5-phosphatase A-like isoform X1 [Girardinichthys multiradiatus]|uniref:inositol polyphosphate-5-phosphatase A-like isoform X1 n=1 Tax=Girardinichthys multiradiatus TaxID=208333 RepID=UPI001FABED22|nr:inositol polyphosphate-5-phosphatase A-like isoform X1 [Girardinichthys multiradiatus]